MASIGEIDRDLDAPTIDFTTKSMLPPSASARRRRSDYDFVATTRRRNQITADDTTMAEDVWRDRHLPQSMWLWSLLDRRRDVLIRTAKVPVPKYRLLP